MSTFPTGRRADFLDWCQAHVTPWTENAADIGLTPAQAASFAGRTEDLAKAVLDLNAARQAFAVAAQAAKEAFRRARAEAAARVGTIRAFAGASKNPLPIYNDAQIDPPAKRSPAPPPARPTQLAATLAASDGSLTLTWKASNPAGTSGTTYIIRRRIPSAAPGATGEPGTGAGDNGFVLIGVTGNKAFVDATIVAGTAEVQYMVQGQRGASTGPVSAILTVNFGQTTGKPARSAAATGGSAGLVARNGGVMAGSAGMGGRSAMPGAALRHGTRALRHGTRALRQGTRAGSAPRSHISSPRSQVSSP